MKVPGVFDTSFDPPEELVGTAVLVPGTAYPPPAPLLFFTGLALLQHGWRVVHHWWDPPKRWLKPAEAEAWVRDQVTGALPGSGRVLVVGKSLGTWAAPVAAARALPSIWLTPLLDQEPLVSGIAANGAPQLLIGGTADQIWDREVARRLESETCRVVEITDADHGILVPGDLVRGVEKHVEVAQAVVDWLAALS